MSKPPFLHSDKSVIPHAWLTTETSIDAINNLYSSFCKSRVRACKRPEVVTVLSCEKGEEKKTCIITGNPFKHPLTEGHKVYQFKNPKNSHYEAGWALIIHGVIVEIIILNGLT